MKTQSLISRALCFTLFLFVGSAAFAKDKDDKDHKKKGSSAKKPSDGPSKGPGGPAAPHRPSGGPSPKGKSHPGGPSHAAPSGPSRSGPGGPSRSVPKPGPSHVVHHTAPRIVVAPHRPPVVLGIRRPVVRPVGPLPSLRVTQISGGTAYSVQSALAERGFYEGAIDGLIGPMTRGAIASFQSEAGLPVTGEINSALLRALGL